MFKVPNRAKVVDQLTNTVNNVGRIQNVVYGLRLFVHPTDILTGESTDGTTNINDGSIKSLKKLFQ